MEIRYLIGIDFGHGETTASCIDVQETNPKPVSLTIHDGSTDEQKKVMSCLWKDEKAQWHIGNPKRNYFTELHVDLKGPMDEITEERKEYFGIFIKMVFERILEHQNLIFHYDPETGERNFEIFIACPSGWDKQIPAYLEFVKSVIPVKWVIRESDAAYFKFKDEFNEDSTLVIDYGSSTIDFTYYDNENILWTRGVKRGASRVEKEIVKFFEQDRMDDYHGAREEYKKGKALLTDAESQKGSKQKQTWDMDMLLGIKELKEEFYAEKYDELIMDMSYRALHHPELGRGRLFDLSIPKAFLEGEILGNYYKEEGMSSQKYAPNLYSDLQAMASQCSPKTIVLTGGASRMDWFRAMVEEIFKTSSKCNVIISRDANPSYAVSDGIVAYAYAKYKYCLELKRIAQMFWDSHGDEELKRIISCELNESLRAVQKPLVEDICNRFRTGVLKDSNGVCSAQALITAMEEHNRRVFKEHNDSIILAVNQLLSKRLNQIMSEKIKLAFETYFSGPKEYVDVKPNLDVNLKGIWIKNDVFANEVATLNKRHGFHFRPISNPFDRDYESKSLWGRFCEWIGDCNPAGRIDEPRTEEERMKIADKFIEWHRNGKVLFKDATLSELVLSLKQSLEKTIKELCEKTLFETFK